MIISGANLNITPALQRQSGIQRNAAENNGGSALGGILSRRFDTLELSGVFKKLQAFSGEDMTLTEMKKMLAGTETEENAEKLSKGAAGYACMEIAIAGEAARAKANEYLYGRYAEERDYYKGLLENPEEAARCADENSGVTGMYRSEYEYLCPEGAAVNRERAEQALANVQGKIDSLIDKARENRIDRDTFNRCAAAAANAFGAEGDEFTLGEVEFNKLFDNSGITEENLIETCAQKAKSLYKLSSRLRECRDNFMENIRRGENGTERAKAAEKVFAAAHGDSFMDIKELMEEILQEKKAEE